MGTETLRGYVASASNAQRRLWFIDRLTPGTAVYNVPAALRLRGDVDAALLRRVLTLIVHRHDTLRTCFGMQDGLPVQLVSEPAECALPVREIEHSELDDALQAEARLPFDLAAGPLFRAVLFRVNSADQVLMLTLHHIVADGWSMNVLVAEFVQAYRALASGADPGFEELPVQFADFVDWQNEMQADGTALNQFREWKKHLEGAPLVLDLPGDFPRPPEQSFRGAVVTRTLSAGISQQLHEIARAEGVTLFMLLLAVFEVLLSRCSGQKDFLVGTPVAGRSHPDTEKLIGFFVNTLVLRADIGGNPSFRDLLARVREECLAAFAHEDVPFDRLVDALQPGRDRSRTPLFQTYFAFQEARAGNLVLPSVESSVLDVSTGTCKVDLTLSITAGSSELQTHWEYCADLFSADTVHRWARIFETLCLALADGAEVAVGAMPLLTPLERADVVTSGNAGAAPIACPETLHGWFARIAAANPARLAITDRGVAMSYAELDRRSDRLARLLQRTGAGVETRVGICMERGAEWLVAILGVLKAGAAYVPVDPAYPRDRIEFILADSGVAAMITNEQSTGLSAIPVIDLRLAASAIQDEDEIASPPAAEAAPANAAYVIYTSGSTGRPKGCVITHGAVARLMLATERWFSFGNEDVWTLFHSFAFDFSVWEIWGALLYGGRLVIVPREVSRSPETFHDMLADERVTVLNQTPSAFRQLSGFDAGAARMLALRYVIFGGEALDVSTLASWMDRYGDQNPQLINMYGITETTVHVTYRRLYRSDVAAGAGSVIGVPIPDLSLYLVDECLEPVPAGVPGEILVGGAGLARGYLDRPALTAERFIANPFGPGRLYRSGDLARRLPDGGLEYLGRIDQQVKVRGFRIEPGEIERVLLRVPGVSEAFVAAKADPGGGKRLVAYLVANDEPTAPEAAREFCRAWLPDYMIPAAFVALRALPLTNHGKVDRGALPEPDVASAATTAFVAPATASEVELAGIWSRVLGVSRVGVEDNFFALGGDSILTIQVVTLARKAGLNLSPKDLFEQQNLRGLAAVAATAPLPPVASAVASSGAGELFPAAPMQAGMLFQALLEPERDVYFEQVSADIHGALSTGAFRSAWQGLMDRHPALRTSFHWRDGGSPLQKVNPQVQLSWTEHDWSELSVPEKSVRWDNLLADERRLGFALDQAPLWRLTLVRFAPDHHRWLWSHFHGLLDGWCLPLVFQDVLADYEFLAHGLGTRPPAGLPYRPYVEWLLAQDRSAAEDYWRRTLAGFEEPTALLLPPASPDVQTVDGHFELNLSAEQSQALRDWARQNHLTLNTVFQGAWALVLSRCGAHDDVVFGVTVAGRPPELEGTDRTLGLFINTLPQRVAVAPGAEPRAWLDQIQRAQAEMRRFDYSSLADIQNLSDVPHGRPLFESILVFENYPGEEALRALPSTLRMENLRTAERTNYLLTAAVVPGNQIAMRLHFDARRLSAASAEQLLHAWRRIAAELTSAKKIGNISISEGRIQPRPATVFRHEKCVHRIVAAQAALHPDAPALIGPRGEISYSRMVSLAAGLAEKLHRRGVGPEKCVAVCMEKSPELVIAWLAVLMAGGAFVPVDPRFALTRLGPICAGTRPIVILVDEPGLEATASVSLPVLRADRDLSPGNFHPVGVSPRNLAYVIHTSGSTGTPKGVMLSHEGLSNLALAQSDICGLGPRNRGLQFASVSFDAAVSEIFMTLVSGAAIWLEPREHVPDPSSFAELFHRARIDNATLPPALLQTLSPGDFPGLRTLLVAGEAASEELFLTWAQGGRRVFNAYGPTETTVCATMEEVSRDRLPITLGTPLVNTTVFIVDRQLNPLPPGVPGEIVVGGAGVARGYLGQARLTAESFIPDPFATSEGSRLYRTGDRGRWTMDGRVEFLGRVDGQIKVRGFRVEPEEVAAALRTHPAVTDAIVLAKNDDRGNYLAAFAVAGSGPAQLSEHLRAVLPDYLIPRSVTVLPAWPLTAAGKIDRRGLVEAEPDPAGLGGRGDFANEIERDLARIWADTLRIPEVGPEDNFFGLGGDSILSLQIVARANQAGLVLTPRHVFRNPTVRRLAQVTERRSETGRAADTETGPVALTPIQNWFFEQAHDEPHHWNQALVLELRDPVLVPFMEQALTAVVAHHGSFRLRFRRAGDGRWLQHYAPVAEITAGLRRYPESEMSAAVPALQGSLSLTDGPLWRAAVFERGAGKLPLLFLAIHHLVIDGVSWRILAEDLALACIRLAAGSPVALPLPTASFGHWSRALTTFSSSGACLAEEPYWRSLAACAQEIPADYPSGSVTNDAASAEIVSGEMDGETTARMLRDANAAYRLNTSELLLAALARTLTGWSGHSEHVIDLEGHGREELSEAVDVTRTVGWFTTIFPFRLGCPSSGTSRDLLTGVKESLRAVPGKGIGFGLLRYLTPDASVRGRMAEIPVPRLSFNYLGQTDQTLSEDAPFALSQIPVGAGHSPRSKRVHWIDINAIVSGGKLRVDWIYCRGLYERLTVERLSMDFLNNLRDLISHCLSPDAGACTASDFEMAGLSAEELSAVFEDLGEPATYEGESA